MYLSLEWKQWRTIMARLKPWQELFEWISQILKDKNIKAWYIPLLQWWFSNAKLISMTHNNEQPDNPIDVELEYKEPLEYFWTWTIAEVDWKPSIHIHLTWAQAWNKSITGHLVSWEITLLTEIVIVEITWWVITREKDSDVFDYPLLTFK